MCHKGIGTWLYVHITEVMESTYRQEEHVGTYTWPCITSDVQNVSYTLDANTHTWRTNVICHNATYAHTHYAYVPEFQDNVHTHYKNIVHTNITHMHICTFYTYTHMYIHTCTHTHIHTCTHTHTHIHTLHIHTHTIAMATYTHNNIYTFLNYIYLPNFQLTYLHL
jgi:hypothetical protein